VSGEHQELIDIILGTECCLVLETTNGVSSRKLHKIDQATNARDYLSELSGKQVHSGLVYARAHHRFEHTNGLDVIAEVTFEHEKTIEALDRVIEDTLNPKTRRVAREMLAYVLDGIPFENIGYPVRNNYPSFRRRYPHIARNARGYGEFMSATGALKGEVVPMYVELAIAPALNGGHVRRAQEYRHNGLCGDIDVFIAGDTREIFHAITQPLYFKPVQQTEEARKASGRLVRAA